MKGQDTTTLCAVGGLVVGSAVLSLSSNAVIKQMLRGTVRVRDGGVSIIGGDRVLPPTTSVSSDKEVATLIDTDEKSIEEEVEILYEWKGNEPPNNNTTLETGQPMVYSERILKELDNSISRRTNLFSSGFRLKLFWREGYYWQESSLEAFWCMGCGDCKENDVMKLTNCKTKTDADAVFERIHQKRGDQYRVVGTNLCLQKLGRRGTNIALKPCKKNNAWQHFTGFRGAESFDIRVRKQKGRCLTNHHHPKEDEVVYAESCFKAHKTKTGYWSEY